MSGNGELRGALVDLFERHGFYWSETEIKAVLDASGALGDAWSWKMAADEAEKEVAALRAALDDLLGEEIHHTHPDSDEMAEIRRVLGAPALIHTKGAAE